MKFLLDIFPIIVFFVAFKFWGIYIATAVAMGASFLQILTVWFLKKKIEYTLWINVIVIAIFGGLTLLFHNELFIKWKPTILYALFALILLGGEVFYKKNLVKTLISSTLELPENIWKKVNWSWIIFFSLLALLNIIVAYSVSTDAWVNFKLFGLLGLTVVFVIGQSVWLSRYMSLGRG